MKKIFSGKKISQYYFIKKASSSINFLKSKKKKNFAWTILKEDVNEIKYFSYYRQLLLTEDHKWTEG